MPDPLKNCGFTATQVAEALEYCDNDRDRALGYLKKQQKSGGKLQWNDALRMRLETVPDGDLKWYMTKMLEYDNVPIKPKQFKNFARNSFALTRNEVMVEQIWAVFEPLVRKPS
eukprot:SAG11_NODE_12078_length_723_cov_0.633013_1_plen_113_part_10